MQAEPDLPCGDATPGVDFEALFADGHHLLIHRRQDGGWYVARSHNNPRKREKTQTGHGGTLEAALRDLSPQPINPRGGVQQHQPTDEAMEGAAAGLISPKEIP